MKILSTHDLQAIMQRAENALRLREQSNKKIAEKSCGLTIGTDHLQILVCGGTGCTASSGEMLCEICNISLPPFIYNYKFPGKMSHGLQKNFL